MQGLDVPQRNTSSVYFPTVRSDFDFPLQPRGAAPAQKLLFATLPRCGSHFICQRFFATGYAGLPLEYFNPAHWDRWRVRMAAEAAGRSPTRASLLGEASTPADDDTPRTSDRHTLAGLLRRRTGPNGCFSAKLHYSHLQHLKALMSEAQIREAHWVQIERLDSLAQVVSWELAAQRGSWIYTQKVWRNPVYDFASLRRRLIQLLRDRHLWKRFFEKRNIRPQILCYEAFAADPDRDVAAVLDAFGLRDRPLPPDVVFPHIPQIQSQSTAINSQWVERFAADLNEVHNALPGS